MKILILVQMNNLEVNKLKCDNNESDEIIKLHH